MQADPLISVCIPAYNHAPFVGEAIRSVLSQAFDGELEIVVTDDCSSDGTADVIAAFADPRIRLECNPRNLGPSATANRNIARARGRFIALLPSDDIYLPGKLARQLAAFSEQRELGSCFSWMAQIDDRGRPIERIDPYFRPAGVTRETALRHFFFKGNLLSAPTAMIRRDLLPQDPLDPCLWQTQDYDLWVRLCIAAPMRVLEEPLVAYRIRDNGGNMHYGSPATMARLGWEMPRVLSRFLDFPDRDLFLRVFPEAASHLACGLGQREALALIALASDFQPARNFGIEALYEALANPGSAEALENDGHGLRFFYKILGDVDPMQVTKVGLSGELTAEWETLKRNSEAWLAGYQQTLAATDQLRQVHAAVTADYEGLRQVHSAATADYEKLQQVHAAVAADYEKLRQVHAAVTADYEELRQVHAAVTADYEKISVSRDQWRQRAETCEAILRRWPLRFLRRLYR